MLSVTLVLTVLIAAINIFNYRKVINNADDVLNILEVNEGEFPPDTNPDPPKDGQFGDHGGGRKDHGGEMSPEMRFEVRFFTITFDKNGNVTEIDTGKIAAVDTSNARALAESVYAGGKTKGFEGDYRFRRSENGDETLIVFYDCGRSLDNARSFLGISAVISLIGLLIVFVLIAVSSKAVIRPVAEAYEKQKRFITDAGHELKTPLAIIQANTEALELFNGESKWTRNIKTQTVRLNGLMQNLLTLSRMDELSLQLEKKPFSLNTLVCEVWENFAEPAAGRKLTAQILGDDGREYRVLANRDTIAQLLSILFDNAVKYTPRGGRIEVNIRSGADGVRLIQSNTVSEEEESSVLTEDPDRLFERFYRTDSDRSRRKGGYGIGLSAARAIVGANNGSIKAAFGDGRIIFTVFLKEDRT